jgi:hypothetical protein
VHQASSSTCFACLGASGIEFGICCILGCVRCLVPLSDGCFVLLCKSALAAPIADSYVQVLPGRGLAFPSASFPPPRLGGRERERERRSDQPVAPALPQHEVEAELKRFSEIIEPYMQALTPQVLCKLIDFTRPPSIVASILEATALLLGAEDSSPLIVRKVLQGNRIERLREIDPQEITTVQFERVQRLLELPDFNKESVKAVCTQAVPLTVWCRAICNFLAKTRSWGAVEVEAASRHAADGMQQDVHLTASGRREEPLQERRPSKERSPQQSRRPGSLWTSDEPRPSVQLQDMAADGQQSLGQRED